MKLHRKTHSYKTLGLGPVSLVGFIGTDSLVPRPRVRRETWPGYEAKAPSAYVPHLEVIQHFERSIASKMCNRIIFDI